MVRKAETRIAVIGLGFVGLTTALGFAAKGFKVYGYDLSDKIRKYFQAGRIHFHEPHLPEQLRKHARRRFTVSDTLHDAVKNADVIFFCVGTPARGRARPMQDFSSAPSATR